MNKVLSKLSVSAFLILFFSCSNHSNQNLDSWVGHYEYEEEPIQAVAGYYMAMQWSLSIDKKTDTYNGILEVNGQQTFIKAQTEIKGNAHSIAIIFKTSLEGSDENLKAGDTLFLLSKNANTLETNWIRLEPRLPEKPPKNCECFFQTKSGR